jgi:hypothetical protein
MQGVRALNQHQDLYVLAASPGDKVIAPAEQKAKELEKRQMESRRTNA